MNAVKATSKQIQGESSELVMLRDKGGKRHRHRHHHQRDEGSKKHSSHPPPNREGGPSKHRKRSRRHSSSKKRAKSSKHKKTESRSSSSSADGAGEKKPPTTKKEEASSETGGTLSLSTIDYTEKHTQAPAEVLSINKDKVKQVDVVSQKPPSRLERKPPCKPTANKPKASRRASYPRTSMDRHKKELIGALTPEQVAVPRKPAPHRVSMPISSPSCSNPENPRVNEAATIPTEFSMAVPRETRPAPTALKPLPPRRSSGSSHPNADSLKKEMMNELCPSEFMAVTRESITHVRRASGDS